VRLTEEKHCLGKRCVLQLEFASMMQKDTGDGTTREDPAGTCTTKLHHKNQQNETVAEDNAYTTYGGKRWSVEKEEQTEAGVPRVGDSLGLFGFSPPWLLQEKKYHRLLLDASLDLGSNLLDCMNMDHTSPHIENSQHRQLHASETAVF